MQIYDRPNSCWKDVIHVDHRNNIVLIQDVNSSVQTGYHLSQVVGWLSSTVWEISYTNQSVDDLAYYMIAHWDKKVCITHLNDTYYAHEVQYSHSVIHTTERGSQALWSFPFSACDDFLVYTDLSHAPHITLKTCDCGGAKANTTHSNWCSIISK